MPRKSPRTLLLGITALWAMPRSARAQLYVSNSDTVGKYNATTGAPINANFITGLGAHVGIAAAADFLGTGQEDLVWENTVTGQHSIWVLNNGVPANVISLPTSPIQWSIAAAADSPGTGQADLVWENTVTGEHTIWTLNKGVPLSSTKLPTISTEWEIVN